MHRLSLIVVSLLAAIGLWWLLRSASPPKPSPVLITEEISTEPNPQEVSSPIAMPATPTEPQMPSQIEKSPAPQNDKPKAGNNPYASTTPRDVEFQVDGDLALFQGDIVLGKVKSTDGQNTGRFSPDAPGLWESSTIAFSIDEKLPSKERVLGAIEYLNRETALKFRPFQNDKDSIVFTPRKGPCASYLGRMGGHQPIYLDDDCGQQEILHEILHALGFVHEHARTDRDRHIEVLWNNIKPEHWPQFAIVPDRLVHSYTGSVFDFDHRSIMLYEPTVFAISPEQPSLRSRGRNSIEPVTTGLSEVDKERIYYLYGR